MESVLKISTSALDPYFIADHSACLASSGHYSEADRGCLHLDHNNPAGVMEMVPSWRSSLRLCSFCFS